MLRAELKPLQPSELMDELSRSTNSILQKGNLSFALRRLDPVIVTVKSVRDYGLPEDFGANFVRSDPRTSAGGQEFAVTLSDGSSEPPLRFEPEEVFFKRSFESETESRPLRYTVRGPGGRRLMTLRPTPDQAYTIRGDYRPIRFRYRSWEEDVPFSEELLEAAFLRTEIPALEGEYREMLADMLMGEAKNRRAQVFPYMETRGRM